MWISTKDWLNYVNKLSQLNKEAGELMMEYVGKNGFADTEGIINYAYGLVTKYGEGSAALSAEMYDETAALSGKVLPAAEAAETASRNEVAKAVQGTIKASQNANLVGGAVSRLVKRAGADTTLKNAQRDGAQFAWVPMGDTCSFCLTLASRGFQYMSKNALKNGHAEHIHANCDCTYTVRFDNKSGVKGYDPDKYLEMYQNAEGKTPNDKINSMRRMQYQDPAVRDKINAQKRAAYEERNRKLNYGEPESFIKNNKTISASPVIRFENNNLYVADDVKLSNREVRLINNRITQAKDILGISQECDIPIIVVDDPKILASYNPRTNVMFISSRMTDKQAVIDLQEGFAAANNPNSTSVHEFIHWQDAEDYRNKVGIIDSAEPTSAYSIYQRNKAFDRLINEGIDVTNQEELLSISPYALENALDNDFEEVYTEYRTKKLLTG